jgi:hypothetical protein
MKRILVLLFFVTIAELAVAQGDHSYVMGYQTATISVTDNTFFSELHFPGQKSVCGFYDRSSENFYTCDYSTYREIEEDFIKSTGNACCETIDFDARKYYGSLTINGIVDEVMWDDLQIKISTADAKYVIKTDEKEIDAFYKTFYEKGRLGKLKIRLTLVTYDNVVEHKRHIPEEMKRFKKRKKLVKFLRF